MSYREAVARIHNAAPGTFGVQSCTYAEAKERSDAMGFDTVGEPGMDAPENVGFMIAAWLYGKDFGERLCLSNAAGEDTDCTCATLGAILGIIDGASGLPEKWKAPLGDKIVTMCIDKTSRGFWVPETCTELAERIMRVTPGFLGADLCDVLAPGGYTICCADNLYCLDQSDYQARINGSGKEHHLPIRALTALGSNVLRTEYPAFEVMIDMMGEPHFRQGETRKFRVIVRNCFEMRQQQWTRIALHAPAGVEVLSASEVMLPLNNLWGATAEMEFAFNAGTLSQCPSGTVGGRTVGRTSFLWRYQAHLYAGLLIHFPIKRAVAQEWRATALFVADKSISLPQRRHFFKCATLFRIWIALDGLHWMCGAQAGYPLILSGSVSNALFFGISGHGQRLCTQARCVYDPS